MPPDVEFCVNHADRPAVERCEVCRRPVCGSCLWYAQSGERLCPEDAAIWRASGRTVLPPERYAAGIPHSEAESVARPLDPAPYRGNSTDLSALLAAAIGLTSLASSLGLACFLPLAAFLLGFSGWLNAKDAIDPRRTRWLSGVGMATGGVYLLTGLAFVTLCLMCFVLTLAVPGNRNIALGTPTP